MSSSYSSLLNAIKHAGLRLTPQRLAICQLLAETDEHPTAAQIYQALKPQYPSLSLATVYNTLEALVELGVLNVLGHAGDDQVHYDADTQPHVNLACIVCHTIVDIPSEYVQQLQGEIAGTSGFRLLGARVLYYGICPQCQAKQAAMSESSSTR